MSSKSSSSSGMSSGTKWGIATIVFGVVSFAGILIYFSKKSKAAKVAGTVGGGNSNTKVPTSGGTNNGTVFVPSTTKPSSTFSNGFPLKNGSRDSGTTNYPVKRLQWALQGLGKKIEADGIFGPKTEAALVSVTGSKVVNSEQELTAIEALQYKQPEPAPIYDILGLGSLLKK